MATLISLPICVGAENQKMIHHRYLLYALRFLVLGLVLHSSTSSFAQADQTEPEFPKGWRFPLEFSQGFAGAGENYAGSLSLGANYAVVPGHLRIGLLAGPGVLAGKLDGWGGVRLALRVKTFNTAMGSWGNLQVQAEHLWLTRGIGLVGGGPVMEVGDLLLVGVKGYYAYSVDGDGSNGLFQLSIGLNMFKPKPSRTDNDPFTP